MSLGRSVCRRALTCGFVSGIGGQATGAVAEQYQRAARAEATWAPLSATAFDTKHMTRVYARLENEGTMRRALAAIAHVAQPKRCDFV